MNTTINLNDLTLVSVTSVNIDSAAKALIISSEFCNFNSIKLFSPIKPEFLPSHIEHIEIPYISFSGYSHFIIEKLYKYIHTSYCLIIQADGFIINSGLWDKKFIEFDYIGAPWPESVDVNNSPIKKLKFDQNRVGNGGFSLRSKKLLEICSKINFDKLNYPIKSEDLIICHYLYESMCNEGIKFAPISVACKFAIEGCINRNISLDNYFGFHGKHWLTNSFFHELASKSRYSDLILDLLPRNTSLDKNISQKITGRLDPCPCGSNLKFKLCHGRLD